MKRAQRAFCEQTYPAEGEGSRKFAEPSGKLIPGVPMPKEAPRTGWLWFNLWATWCIPCIEEMPLLDRWMKTLQKDDVDIRAHLWSVDDDEDALKKWIETHDMPGPVRWTGGADELDGILGHLGVEKGSAIPVHALVDPKGQLRCVRVGVVHDEDYASVKALVR